MRRHIVIHHTHLIDGIMKHLKPNDAVFFDDCLYSQFKFIKSNIAALQNLGTVCILGLSPKLMRKPCEKPLDAIESWKIHEDTNKHIFTKNDAYYSQLMNGFMALEEVKELLQFSNVFLALHGCCHLDLAKMRCSIIDKIHAFKNDVVDGKSLLKSYSLETDMFVYPYDYSFQCSDAILKKNGFKKVFGANRTYIEELVKKQ